MTLSEFIFMPYNYLCQKQYAIAQEIFVENYSEAAKIAIKELKLYMVLVSAYHYWE